MLEQIFQIEVNSINPMTARKNVFGKARVKGMKAKDLVKLKIEEMYNTKKWCKHTTRGNWDKRNIDMYDGLVMSLFENKA
jgi:ribosomal protein L23